MKKNILVFVLCMLFLAFFAGCSNQQDDKVVLRFAYGSNAKPLMDAMAQFGEILAEKTNGEVVVEYFPDGQLGSERELIELTQTGAVQIAKVNGGALESFSNKYSIFGLPYLFDDENHFYEVMESDIVKPIYQSTEDLGFVGLTYYDSGQRSFYLTDGPVEHPDDLKGKKVRVMQSDTQIKMVELLGGSPTPMGAGEVYTSLQQGILDGAENNEFALTEGGHGDVSKYYSYDEHGRVPDIVIINKATLDELSEEHRNAVLEAAYESTQYEKSVWKEAVEATKQRAIDEFGVTFNEVDKAPFQLAVEPLHEQFKNNPDFKDIYEQIKSLSVNEG
ncbi:TRAP transporter substrate-binding protein [Bacillus sp. PS06]|uniref:TRAP transporter substrate-binding protein n=1 Tax=Bacillus sp. PS06 TaxID=2764176 RepID=UPI001784AD8F|nr:TRAP transporter substrate-binding protein [Bacillus sp. PS06]MBD8067803.1 TRAP transporter substrate-binding protein [Bacillus sp. PS06]